MALEVGIGAGAEIILTPEIKCDLETLHSRLVESQQKGKKSGIIVMAEGAGSCKQITKEIEEKTG